MTETLFDSQPTAGAHLSACGTYRYNLWRQWDDRPLLGWVMLNPSTADAMKDDPTIRRCIGFAKSWGYGGIVVRNLYALRSTNPTALWSHADPVGPDNDAELAVCSQQPLTVLAWGSNAEKERSATVAGMLWDTCALAGVRLTVLGWTKAHQPRHPLYVAAATQPEMCDYGALVGS